jgi:hypothetical protein
MTPTPRSRKQRDAGTAEMEMSEQTAVAASPFPEASANAKRLAAAILEVLAGVLSPAEAARSLGLSLARYYQLEVRALAGLLAACELRHRGRQSVHELGALRRECERLRRECARQQALVRAARRTVGLTPPAPPPPAAGSGAKRRRRPTARALKMAALLREDSSQATDAPAPEGASVEQTPPPP